MSITDVLEGRALWAYELGDCVDVMRELPDGSIDHVMTDPPYESEAHTKFRRSQRGSGKLRKTGAGFVSFPIDFEAMDPATRWLSAKQFARLTRRWALVFCQLEGVGLWRDACKWYGLEHRRPMIWVKPDGKPSFSGDRPGIGYECIEVMHARGKSRWNGGGRRGVLTYNCNSQTRIPDEDSQTPKPLDLMLELVELFTDPGDLILDPYADSATTLVAALRLGRRAIGIEMNPKHHARGLERVVAELNSSTLKHSRAGQIPLFLKESTNGKEEKRPRQATQNEARRRRAARPA